MNNDNIPQHDATRRPKSIYAAGPVSINESWPQGLPERFDLPITMVDEQPDLFPDLRTDPQPATGVDAVLNERGSRYGKFTTHAEVTQTLKAVFRAKMGAKWDHLADDQKESLEMIAHKLGRIINGDPDYADSWVDIAGYAKLVADRLEGVER